MKLQNEFRKVTARVRRAVNERHRKRHVELHQALDELCADWAAHQPLGSVGKMFSNTTIMELMEWSYKQTQEPDD
jgi:hypothetical protein